MSDLREQGLPEISILMTAFNAAAFVSEAIDSVLAQSTKRSWELLFVDDGSIDNTFDVVSDYASRFPSRIRVLQHANGENRGISASRNLALRYARGRLLAFLDSDDVWLPSHLETQAALMDRHPRVAMGYAGAERWVDFTQPFNEETARAARWGENYLPPLVPEGERAGLLPAGTLLNWFRKDESLVPCICTVMVRTSVARSVGGFCDDFRGLYDDQVFHVKVAQGHEVYANDVCVARYRQHSESCCARARRQDAEEKRERERFESYLSELRAQGCDE